MVFRTWKHWWALAQTRKNSNELQHLMRMTVMLATRGAVLKGGYKLKDGGNIEPKI
eukprot:TRINITY_DN7757_c0_g1_i1.p1 TRINITY_DN7757_c0_g1~~TRINITY_DN7757_c0_g1_i1.p1  ORF type:complete len:56 (-),score=1.78 TRINITY_DN7757_c0_g1_i1:214-381(-)